MFSWLKYNNALTTSENRNLQNWKVHLNTRTAHEMTCTTRMATDLEHVRSLFQGFVRHIWGRIQFFVSTEECELVTNSINCNAVKASLLAYPCRYWEKTEYENVHKYDIYQPDSHSHQYISFKWCTKQWRSIYSSIARYIQARTEQESIFIENAMICFWKADENLKVHECHQSLSN